MARGWWVWPCVAMAPLALVVCLTSCMAVVNAFRRTRPDGGGPWASIASMGWFSVIALVFYVVPPVLLWWYRPQG